MGTRRVRLAGAARTTRHGGPLGADWARRAGTPGSALARTTSSSAASGSAQSSIAAFSARVNGTLSQSQTASGLVAVNLSLADANTTLPLLRLQIVGNSVAGGGVQMTSSSASLGTTADPTLFRGVITSLNGTAVGAEQVILAYEESRSDTRISLEHALKQRRAARLDSVRFELFAAAEQFLTGQETALMSQINGGLPRPAFIPPRPTERGVHRRPTLVQNVETLAHLALIARRGAEWYGQLGTDSETGSTLVTVVGAVHTPGVYEIECGTPLTQLFTAAGGVRGELAGLLVGGYFGSWLPAGVASLLELSNAALAAHDAALGCGVLVALPASCCPVAETVRVAIYLATETAQQCGPCVHGTAAIARTLHGIAAGRTSARAFADLERWTTSIPGRGACHLPDGLAHFVATALRVFAEAFDDHATHGPCEACAAEPLLPIPARSPARRA
jgi:NADH:ubiquinone oxidoreductase subunit F (NADH-binding)